MLWWASPYSESTFFVAWRLFNLGGGSRTRDNGDDEIMGEKKPFCEKCWRWNGRSSLGGTTCVCYPHLLRACITQVCDTCRGCRWMQQLVLLQHHAPNLRAQCCRVFCLALEAGTDCWISASEVGRRRTGLVHSLKFLVTYCDEVKASSLLLGKGLVAGSALISGTGTACCVAIGISINSSVPVFARV